MEKPGLNRRGFMKLIGAGGVGFLTKDLQNLLNTDALHSPFKPLNLSLSPFEGLHDEKLNKSVQPCDLHVLMPENFGQVMGVGVGRHGIFYVQGDLEMTMGENNLPVPGIYRARALTSNRNLSEELRDEVGDKRISYLAVRSLNLVHKDGAAQHYDLDNFRGHTSEDGNFEQIKKLINPDPFNYRFYRKRS